MLLTASQVSALISGGIIILFTSALFLSGFVLQQRTIGKLRTAVRAEMRPKPSPRHSDYQQIPEGMGHLPDRFKKETTELEDGTVIELSARDLEDMGKGRMDLVLARGRERKVKEGEEEGGENVVEVRRSEEKKKKKEEKKEEVAGSGSGGLMGKMMNMNFKSKEKNEKSKGKQAGMEVEEEEVDIKEMSRAERRRRIKADIHELSQAKEPVYYQRRLW